MKKSEYDALKLKLAAELQEVYEKNRSLVKYYSDVCRESGSVGWAIGQVLQGAYAKDCKYYYAAAMDAIEDFALHHWADANEKLEFEPEAATGHRAEMLVIDEASQWPVDIEYKWHNMVNTVEWLPLNKGSDNEVPQIYGKSLSSLIDEIASANDAGQLLNLIVHPPITAEMSGSGPWPQSGCHPYIPSTPAETSPQTEEKSPEEDSWPGHKPQAAAEDFSAIAKRMKELAAEKGNS